MSQNSIVMQTVGTIDGLSYTNALNNALNTLASTFSGGSAPTPTYASQQWMDETNNILKLRNKGNTAWMSLFGVDPTNNYPNQLLMNNTSTSTVVLSLSGSTSNGLTNYGGVLGLTAGGARRLSFNSSGHILYLGDTASKFWRIASETSDGTDDSSVYLCGGGDTNDTRGAYVFASGNEKTSYTGKLYLAAGNVTGGDVIVRTGGIDTFLVYKSGSLTHYRDQNSLTYHDVSNASTGSSAGAIVRLVSSDAAGSGGTVSADFVKYKTGALLIKNNETDSSVGHIEFWTGGDKRAWVAGDASFNALGYLKVAPGSGATSLVVRGNCIENHEYNGTAEIGINYAGYLVSTTQARNFAVYDGKNVVKAKLYGGTGHFGLADSFSVGASFATFDVASGTQDGACWDGTRWQLSKTGANPLALRRRTSDGAIVDIRRDTTQVGTISVTSTTTAYNTTSDERLKEALTPLSKTATSTLKKIPVYSGQFKAAPSQRLLMLLAHELKAIMPEAVTGERGAEKDVGTLKTPREDIVARDVERPATLEDGQAWIKTTDFFDGERTVEIGFVRELKIDILENVEKPESLPDGATWEKTGVEPVYMMVDYSKLVVALIAAWQELEARVATLET